MASIPVEPDTAIVASSSLAAGGDDRPRKVPRKNVRTGCATCRLRRVKCDEAKPSCQRCSSTGRICDGYKKPAPWKIPVRRSKYTITPDSNGSRRVEPRDDLSDISNHLLPIVKTPRHVPSPLTPIVTLSFDLFGDVEECRSFDYFRHRAMDNISGYFELAFWDYLVLQTSCTESCVRHALLALSSLHESYEILSLESQFPATEKAEYLKRCALSQYTRAIGMLTNGLSTQQPTLQVILICCLIFIWLEFLQDNLDTALGHLKSGLQLLHENRKSSHPYYVDESVVRLFTRLHTQATIHGGSTFGPSARDTTLPSTSSSFLPSDFRDLFEARSFLDTEISQVVLFHRKTENPKFVQDRLTYHPFPDPLSLQAICQSHLQNLQQWYAVFDQMDTASAAPIDEKQLVALAQLQIQYLFVVNSLQTLFTTSQMIYDRFYTDFERILLLAETLILSNHKKFYIYAFDMGVLAPLLYLVLKCRDLGLRRKAIELLKRAPPREGMWERESAIEIAEWKLGKEEKGRGGLSAISALPNCARIYAEGATEKVVDGRKMTVLGYRRGATDLDGEDTYEEEVTSLNMRLASVVGAG